MMNKLKDVIHFYIGCDVVYPETHEANIIRATLTGVSRTDGVETTYKREKGNCSGDYLSWKSNGNHISDALHLKLLLYPINNESITDNVLAELWPVIGGTPHLFEYGKDGFKLALLSGEWDDTGLQIDFYTITCLINKLRSMKFDCDLLIDEGYAIHPDEVTKLSNKKDKERFINKHLKLIHDLMLIL